MRERGIRPDDLIKKESSLRSQITASEQVIEVIQSDAIPIDTAGLEKSIAGMNKEMQKLQGGETAGFAKGRDSRKYFYHFPLY